MRPGDTEVNHELGDRVEVIEVPRSAWITSGMPWTPIACSSMVLAISESSHAAIVQATTDREKMSSTT